jgi:acetyl-CoA acetyltransferase family protein
MSNKVFIIGGARTPFMRSQGKFSSFMAHDLGKFAINGLIQKSGLEPSLVEYVCMGTVISNPHTSNIAREIVLSSMLKKNTPAHTVTMACISSNMASTSIVELIQSRQIECGIAGGTETFSDLPIRFSKKFRQLLLKSKKRSLPGLIKLWSQFRLSHLRPEIPSPKEYSTGFSMGEAGDQLAARFNISRKDADDFAYLSHQRAASAWRAGYYKNEIVPIDVLSKLKIFDQDDGPRPDSTISALASLPASFNKFGINTAGNSSFFSDGAAAIMLTNKEFCNANSLKPLVSIKDFIYGAGDPLPELLLGPALTVPYLLMKNGLKVEDIAVWEIHEAFAGQILANLKAMASKKFCKERLGLDNGLKEIPFDLINLWGGSLSLGHPFGATGARLLWTATKRLIKEDGQYAIVTSCAAGGLGSAILLEREKS